MEDRVVLLLGSNLGDREGNMVRAKELLISNAFIIKETSSIYETASWGKEDQPLFLNQCILGSYEQSATELLELIRSIEEELKRQRKEKWGSRTIDVDILFFGDEVINSEDLIIPHPEISGRRLTLEPLIELMPYFIHPVFKMSLSEIMDECKDPLEVRKLQTT